MLHLFTITGRIRRRTFWWSVPALYALAFACYGLPALAETQFNSNSPHWRNAALAGMGLCFYLAFTQAAKRLHDLNLRSWWLLLGMVPVVSLFLGAGMQFVPGTTGPNRFGNDPRQPLPQALT
ncbi:MAG: DUF805 domain-containing protein [Hymenobacter sp.]|nr:MAG: DUF805 domain-containing protein [Hymenobacter sp.]